MRLRLTLACVAVVAALVAGCDGGGGKSARDLNRSNGGGVPNSGAPAPQPPIPSPSGPGGATSPTVTQVSVTSLAPAATARLGPTEVVVQATLSHDLDASTVAAGVTAVHSRSSIAAAATGTVALSGAATLTFTSTVPWLLDGQLLLQLGSSLKTTGGVPYNGTTPVVFSAAPTSDRTASALIQASSAAAVTLRDGRVLLIGGKGPNPAALATCVLFDPAAGTVTATGSLVKARLGHQAVLLADGRVGVLGGQDGNTMITTIEVWSPATGAWTETAGVTTVPRAVQHSLVRLADGRFLAAGGYPQSDLTTGVAAQGTLELVAADFSGVTAQAATSVLAGPAVVLSNGDVLLLGNRNAGTGSNECQGLRIDTGAAAANVVVSATTFTFTGALAAGPGSDPSACKLGKDDRVIVQRATGVNQVQLTYTGAAPTGVTVTACPALAADRSRTATRLLPLPDGSVLIGPGGLSITATNPAADIYVPGAVGTAGTLVPLTLRTGRRSWAPAVLKDGRAALLGGRSGSLSSGPYVQDVEVLTVEAGAQGALSGLNLVALAASPASGFPIRTTDREVVFTLSGALDAASVVPGNVTVTLNGGAVNASVALRNRREVVVTLAPAVTLAANDQLVVTLGGGIRDTQGQALDATRGAPSATYRVGP